MAGSNNDDVCIPFRSFIKPGETSFVVPIQRKFTDHPKRHFGFESITLMPEYQNIQAFAYKLDSKAELESVVNYPIQLEVSYRANYFSKEEGKAWSYLTSQVRIDTVLSSINQHFEKNKPTGTYYPPVFIDWLHMESVNENETLRGYQEEHAEEIYGEPFNAEKHATWLPGSLANMKQFNNCIFPTITSEEFMDDIRLRLWIAPNTTITFSNQNLPLAMGITAEQMPSKNKRGQIPFVNENKEHYMMVYPWDKPLVDDLPIAELRGVKINCYTTKDTLLSPLGQLVTEKQRVRDPVKLAQDYSKTMLEMGKKMNIYLSLTFDQATKLFKVVFPNNRNIAVRLFVPFDVVQQLGFDPSYGEIIDDRSVPSPVKTDLETEDLEKKSVALVYDAGMVAVDLSQQRSQLSSHSGNFLMATLHPRKDGTLRNRIYFGDVPRVHVSSTNPDLRFMLLRFDDRGIKSPLDWPVGAYVFGTLNGKV